MTQYLVTTFKDSTGRKHTHITKAKSNQRLRQRVKKKRKRSTRNKLKGMQLLKWVSCLKI